MFDRLLTYSTKLIFLLLLLNSSLLAQVSPQRISIASNFIEIYSHNDYYYIDRASDRYFSNGTSILFQSQGFEKGILGFGKLFPWKYQNNGAINTYSIKVDHNVYTPFDIFVDDPVEMDRPFAGLLLAHLANNTYLADGQSILKKEIQLGWVGPAVGGEEIQNWWHKFTNWPEAKGWDYQLQNQLVYGVQLHWWKSFQDIKETDTHNFAYQAGARVTNLTSNLDLGIEYQAGDFLPFINPRYSFEGNFSWNFYIRLQLHFVLYNGLLTGKTVSSTGAEKLIINELIPVLLHGEHGFILRYRKWQMTFGQQVLSPEIKKGAAHLSGSISLRKYFQ